MAGNSHEKIETNIGLMIILIILVISVGGLVQIVPLFFMQSTTKPIEGLKPYPALELAGRDIYIRESCNVCHSQMIRPFRAETERYGHYSVAGEFIYDRPFLWGSKRTGPDLHRVGGRYSDDWHRAHLLNPRDVVPESVMPGYPWFEKSKVDGASVQQRMQVLKNVFGHPYTDEEIANAPKAVEGKTEMDAVIAYLQGMGKTIKTVK
jgi:cytochrome c oxidase cbb3-type subunit 2